MTDVSIKNRIQQMEEGISGVVDTIEELDSWVKENAKSNTLITKYPGNWRHNEKTETKNY